MQLTNPAQMLQILALNTGGVGVIEIGAYIDATMQLTKSMQIYLFLKLSTGGVIKIGANHASAAM